MPVNASDIDIQHMLECLDVRNISRASDQEWRFSCPIPGHPGLDNDPSAYMNQYTGAWMCHSCHSKGGTVSSFVSEALGISIIEASRLLRQRYTPGGIDPDERNITTEVERVLNADATDKKKTYNPPLPEEITKRFAVEWEEAYYHYENGRGFPACNYLFDRGFSPLALIEWGFGYDEISDRVVFAVRNLDGHLIGYKARAYREGQLPRYITLGDTKANQERYGFKPYSPSQVVFGANRVPIGSSVILCEGELNVVAIQEKTGRHAVAISGSHFSDEHAKIIRSIANEAILFFDNDNPGVKATTNAYNKLSRHMDLKLVSPHEGDAAEMTSEQIEEIINKSQDVFDIDVKLILERK